MNIADELLAAVDGAAERYRGVSDRQASGRAGTEWSPKEVIGHLIDSAANNVQRFVRGQAQGALAFPDYDQDHWVRTQRYQTRDWESLVEFWRLFNHHLAHVIRSIPPAALATECRIGDGEAATLGFLVADYLTHLQHHLEQVDERLGRSSAGG